MEIRQLEYFVASVEENSFYKASQKLYTSQPAVSKAIALLEKDVNARLFERTNKGLKLTPRGEKLYHYAKNILTQVQIMKSDTADSEEECLKLASYPSYYISKALTNFYTKRGNMRLDYREGTVQDIIDLVYNGISEFGIVYISPNQESSFKHILAHKHLEFVHLKEGELCIYVGDKHELYNSNRSVSIKELSELTYIRGIKDFFSVEHHFDYVSLNEINTAHFDDKVLTNSDHLVLLMLQKSNLAYLSIDTEVKKVGTKINIASDEKRLILGYIKNKLSDLSTTSEEFIDYFVKYV